MQTYLLRRGSSGLSGSFKNAEHHAKGAVPLIHAAIGVIEHLSPYIAKWGQGTNIHVLEAKDGRKIAFRPFLNNGRWGIQVNVQVSRSVEVPIMTFDKITRTTRLLIVLRDFLKVKENYYGKATQQEEPMWEHSDFEYKYRFMVAEQTDDSDTGPWVIVDLNNKEHRVIKLWNLRCPECKAEMSYHKGPSPHFEHRASMKGYCSLYEKK